MRNAVPITEVRRNFGVFHDIAQDAPVPVMKHGHESVYIVSAKTIRALKAELHRAGLSTELLRPTAMLRPPLG